MPFTPEEKRERREADRRAAISGLGGRCQSCGFSDWRALQIDHINNDGYLERSAGVSGGVTQKVIKRILAGDSSGVQCLCANCHAIKTREERVQPKRALWDEGFGRLLAEMAVDSQMPQ